MYNRIEKIILPYISGSDDLWHMVGLEKVINVLEKFSTKEWDKFIHEIPEIISEVNCKILDCLTLIDNEMALKASVKIAKLCKEGALDLFILRLKSKYISFILKSDLIEIEKNARIRLEKFQSEKLINDYQKRLEIITKYLND